MANQTVGILGLGIFGQSIIEALISQDVEIIAIDNHEETINQYEDMIAVGVIGDITDMELLEAADVGSCDTVIVATGESLESSVLAVMHCKALGVKNVIAKVKDEVTQQVLEKGENIILCPDVEYSSSAAEIGAVYEGFLHLEKGYHRATGKHLAFVPVGLYAPAKRVRMGEPIRFADGVPFARQKAQVALHLRQAITALCTQPEFPPQEKQNS